MGVDCVGDYWVCCGYWLDVDGLGCGEWCGWCCGLCGVVGV